jgi:CheY-like chemotaxis protein
MLYADIVTVYDTIASTMSRHRICEILTGCAVLEAASGAEGLRLAERHAPDGVLVDLAMPGRSGLEVLNELNQRDPIRDIRVVFASAYLLAVLADLAQGADDPLHKPSIWPICSPRCSGWCWISPPPRTPDPTASSLAQREADPQPSPASVVRSIHMAGRSGVQSAMAR